MVYRCWVSHGVGSKITSKDMQSDTAMLSLTSDLWLPGVPPSPAGNSAAEVWFEEPVGADLQTRGHPGTEVGGGSLETEHRQGRKGSSLQWHTAMFPSGLSGAEDKCEQRLYGFLMQHTAQETQAGAGEHLALQPFLCESAGLL